MSEVGKTGPIETTNEDNEEAQALESLKSHLAEASLMLGTWYRSKDSDSVSMQELRKREYARACDLLRLIVGTSRYVNHKLVATAAEDGELLDTRDLTRHTYGGVTVERGRQPLQPGESFDLKDERTLTYHLRRVSNVYFGHYTAYLEAADIAKLLANGGKLELVPVTDAPESN